VVLHTAGNVTYEVAESEALKLAAKALCHDVYLEFGYIEKRFPEGIIPEDRNDGESMYIVARTGDCVCGTIRLRYGVSPFSVFRAWAQKLDQDSRDTLTRISTEPRAELGRLAVSANFRTGKVSQGLYKSAWLLALIKQIAWYLIRVDQRALTSLERCGYYVQRIGPPLYWMGSPTVPAVMEIGKQLSSVYEKNPKYYQYLVNGVQS